MLFLFKRQKIQRRNRWQKYTILFTNLYIQLTLVWMAWDHDALHCVDRSRQSPEWQQVKQVKTNFRKTSKSLCNACMNGYITCDVNVVRLGSFCALNVTLKSFHCLKFVLYSPRLEWEGDRQDGGQGNKNISNIRKHNIKWKKRNIRRCNTLINHF